MGIGRATRRVPWCPSRGILSRPWPPPACAWSDQAAGSHAKVVAMTTADAWAGEEVAVVLQTEGAVAVEVAGVILLGAVLGYAVRITLGRRTTLSMSAMVLIGIIGAFLGGLVPLLLAVQPGKPHPGLLVASALAGTIIIFLVVQRWARPLPPEAGSVIAAGESATVEFKSTARHNVRSGQRDDRIEAAVVKTVAGFLNGGGGILLIGVDDSGAVLGLDNDLRYMKQPDIDRFELWLTDHLTRCLGEAALAEMKITFPTLAGQPLVMIVVQPSLRPVFARLPKSDGARFYVRMGNSTRELPVDQAVAFCADRFRAWRLRGRRR